jgi:N6-adenosine-specific RNA methylase IME4
MTFLAVMDPPWSSDNGGGGRGAQNHYDLSKPADVAAVVRSSGLWVEEGPALVWMWATTRAVVLGHAHKLAEALGLRIVSGFVWVKVDVEPTTMASNRNNQNLYMPPAKLGLGQWQRTEHEHLLVCVRGKVRVPTTDARCRSVIYAPRGRHSAKPEEAWAVIERTSEGALGARTVGVEFFARTQRRGWLSFGVQLGGAP